MFKNNLGTVVVLALAPLIYAAERFPDYPVRPAGDYVMKAERGGLIIGIEPVEDLKDQKTYFDAHLTSKGFIPVFLVIQNGSDKETLPFHQVLLRLCESILKVSHSVKRLRSQMQLVLADGNRFKSAASPRLQIGLEGGSSV